MSVIVYEVSRCNSCDRHQTIDNIDVRDDGTLVLWVGCMVCGYDIGWDAYENNGKIEVMQCQSA